MPESKGQIAVFLSGRGSNFDALYQASIRSHSNFAIAYVVSDNPQAPGCDKARERTLPVFANQPRTLGGKDAFEEHVIALLRERQVALICLAGYMRIVGPRLLAAYPGRILNIHPALLPAFPGLHAQQQALDAGVKVSGCTVHFVDAGIDSGPIVLQAAVPVYDHDDEESLSTRILHEEHRIYAEAVRLFFQDKLHIEGRRVRCKNTQNGS